MSPRNSHRLQLNRHLAYLTSIRDISCHLSAAYASCVSGGQRTNKDRRDGSQPPYRRTQPSAIAIRDPHRTIHIRPLVPRRPSCNACRLPPPHRLELVRRYYLVLLQTALHLPLHTHPTESETLHLRHRHYQRLLRESQHAPLAYSPTHIERVLSHARRASRRKSRDTAASVRTQGSTGLRRRWRTSSVTPRLYPRRGGGRRWMCWRRGWWTRGRGSVSCCSARCWLRWGFSSSDRGHRGVVYLMIHRLSSGMVKSAGDGGMAVARGERRARLDHVLLLELSSCRNGWVEQMGRGDQERRRKS